MHVESEEVIGVAVDGVQIAEFLDGGSPHPTRNGVKEGPLGPHGGMIDSMDVGVVPGLVDHQMFDHTGQIVAVDHRNGVAALPDLLEGRLPLKSGLKKIK